MKSWGSVMKVFFRFNCGNMWGLGHLYRNMTLMEEMFHRGFECEAIINENRIAQEILNNSHIKFTCVEEYETAEKLMLILNKTDKDKKKVIFWDRLDSTSEYVNNIIDAGIKIITYDDYDISALKATSCINTRIIPLGNVIPLFSGPSFQILRNDIREYSRKNKVIKQNVTRVLLHFGGTDPLNILETCFEALKDFEGCLLEFIGGKDENRSTQQKIKESNTAYYEQGVPDFGSRLFEADMCLIAGGVSMYEAAAIGTPMINICHNEDQNYAANIFKKNVGSINLGIASKLTHKEICDAFSLLKNDYMRRKIMSEKMKAFVPSNGVEKVSDIIENVIMS